MANRPLCLWRIVDDSGVDYNFLRAFSPEVKDGDWLGKIVPGSYDPITFGITVCQPFGEGTYTADPLHFELVDSPLNHLIQASGTCHFWMGPAPQRRPIVREGKSTKSARRVIWELCMGPITKSQVIVDICNQPMCMRLSHLRVKSRGQVVKDSLR